MLISLGPLAFEEGPWPLRKYLCDGHHCLKTLQTVYELLRTQCSGLLVPICCAPAGLGGAVRPMEGASLAWRRGLRSCLRDEREALRER